MPLLGILEQAAFLRPTGASGEFGRRLCDRISVKEWLQPPSRLHDFFKGAKGLLDVESRLLDWTLVLLDAFIL